MEWLALYLTALEILKNGLVFETALGFVLIFNTDMCKLTVRLSIAFNEAN
ncbi:hypothetical protein LSAJ160_90028 [Latilactobacillus sakei]|nr:hypothetical protein LSAJ160_90028 [Latilactobacillus sakei]